MNLIRLYKGKGTKAHEDYDSFNERMVSALHREKFNRDKNLQPDSTPSSIINCNKYILEFENKSVFVCAPNFLFEELLDIMFKISKSINDTKLDPTKLILATYHDPDLRALRPDWDYYPWTKNFDTFYAYLIEESFLYFDDMVNQYYFNLFRSIKAHGFEGGVLHALSRHFGEFTKFNSNPNYCGPFIYKNFMFSLISCCVNGELAGKPEDKGNDNYVQNKQLKIETKYLQVGTYWENRKKLFFLNTCRISSKPYK